MTQMGQSRTAYPDALRARAGLPRRMNTGAPPIAGGIAIGCIGRRMTARRSWFALNDSAGVGCVGGRCLCARVIPNGGSGTICLIPR